MRDMLTEDCDRPTLKRELKIDMMEWMEIITQGIYPSEQRLEHLLDHIEGTP